MNNQNVNEQWDELTELERQYILEQKNKIISNSDNLTKFIYIPFMHVNSSVIFIDNDTPYPINNDYIKRIIFKLNHKEDGTLNYELYQID